MTLYIACSIITLSKEEIKMYKCENCKIIIEDYNDLAEDFDGYKMCPHCNGDVLEVEDCDCGDVKEKDELLCETCKMQVLKEFQEFMDNFTENERRFLNEFYDGQEF